MSLVFLERWQCCLLGCISALPINNFGLSASTCLSEEFLKTKRFMGATALTTMRPHHPRYSQMKLQCAQTHTRTSRSVSSRQASWKIAVTVPAPSQFAAVKQKGRTWFHALFQLSGKTQSCFTFVAVGLQNALVNVKPPQFKVLADTQPCEWVMLVEVFNNTRMPFLSMGGL